MRLIHTSSFNQSAFFGDTIPRYTVLSHTWGSEEVTFQDYSALDLYNEGALRGYLKIRYLCEQARRYECDWAWIDTACIDKTSSAELSEAINSMMSWYRSAAICYAYLDDVTDMSNFKESRWFTRGWTLQELLAPQLVKFYGKDWKDLGTKSTLATEIFTVTKIHKVVLETPEVMDQFSIATRMSWAARRETTRVEDIAYSLLGIFNVNMSPIYGEGIRAFIRLQQEIIKTSNDESIFAGNKMVSSGTFNGLASAPSMFASDRETVPLGGLGSREPFSMTNKGLFIHLHLWKDDRFSHWGIFNCRFQHSFDGKVAIPLLMIKDNSGIAVFFRKHGPPRLFTNSEASSADYIPIHIRQQSNPKFKELQRFLYIVECNKSLRGLGYKVSAPDANKGSSFWNSNSQISEVVYTQASYEIYYNRIIVNLLFQREDKHAFIITVVEEPQRQRAGFRIDIKPEGNEYFTWFGTYLIRTMGDGQMVTNTALSSLQVRISHPEPALLARNDFAWSYVAVTGWAPRCGRLKFPLIPDADMD
jgi:hypothetical protein